MTQNGNNEKSGEEKKVARGENCGAEEGLVLEGRLVRVRRMASGMKEEDKEIQGMV